VCLSLWQTDSQTDEECLCVYRSFVNNFLRSQRDVSVRAVSPSKSLQLIASSSSVYVTEDKRPTIYIFFVKITCKIVDISLSSVHSWQYCTTHQGQCTNFMYLFWHERLRQLYGYLSVKYWWNVVAIHYWVKLWLSLQERSVNMFCLLRTHKNWKNPSCLVVHVTARPVDVCVSLMDTSQVFTI